MGFAKDFVGVDYHSDGHTHIDALCHVAYEGRLYNGVAAGSVTAEGAAAEGDRRGQGRSRRPRRAARYPAAAGRAVARARRARVSRGPRGRRARAGRARSTRATSCSCAPGTPAAWPSSARGTPSTSKAGLHPTAMPLLAERGVAALGCDGNSDTAPSTTEGVAFPIHVLALNAMGVLLLDYLQFEDLRGACESAGRWEFLCVTAPLRIDGGTGSPVNPLAIL